MQIIKKILHRFSNRLYHNQKGKAYSAHKGNKNSEDDKALVYHDGLLMSAINSIGVIMLTSSLSSKI